MFLLAATYFSFDIESNAPDFLVESFLQREPVLYAHIFSSMIALIIGPFQFFLRRLTPLARRSKYLPLHRWLGRIYVTGALLGGAEHSPMLDVFMAVTHWFQGSATVSRGDSERANALYEQALALTRQAGGQWFVAYVLLTLGARALGEAECDKAVSHYSESLPLFRDTNDVTGIAITLAGLGTVAWLQGDHEQALRLHRESLANFRDSREGSAIGFCLECQAGGVRPPGGLPELVERHNERLDLPPEEWSKEVIDDAVSRSGKVN